jgi:asparagine synthase (glutamine-hydrolysing)
MCGFVAMVGFNGVRADPGTIERMAETIRHRGPDEHGYYVNGSVGFGFRRLSILDLSSSGHQPMWSPDGRVLLVFNGEIYNYVELRRELQALGSSFRSSGDTEVLLHSYLQWGPSCLNRFNGMWSFLIYDSHRQCVFGSRDRFGKKPLYCYAAKDRIFFASEIKAILTSGHYNGGVDWKKASSFLLSQSFDQVFEDDRTFFTGIEQLPGGSAFELDLRGMKKQWRFWSLSELHQTDLNVTNPPEALYELFEDAVRLRLRSDVPVGIFLSGGLDSTSLACVFAQLRKKAESQKPILAFCFHSEEYDESAYVNDTIRQTGIQLVRFEPNPLDLWDRLERFIWHQDEPVHSMAVLITFELSRLAAEHGVKVILNGGGPDEYFAGYGSLFSSYWHGLLTSGQIKQTYQEIEAYCKVHGGKPLSVFGVACNRLFRSGLSKVPVYRRLSKLRKDRELKKKTWFTPELSKHISNGHFGYLDISLDASLKRAVEFAPLPLYLRIEDRNSMAHSVEVRMPFLDYRLVELAFQLPSNWKMRGPWNKFGFREAMRGKIPDSVRKRPDKMGFPVPTKSWFAGPLSEPINDLLHSRKMRERGIYDIQTIQRDWELHRQGKRDVSDRLFNLVQFEVWSDSTEQHDYRR